MESRINHKSSTKTRRNKSDLIDLSQEIEDSSCNNILDLFDPLGHSTNEQAHNNPDRPSNKTSLISSDLRRRDRRFRSAYTETKRGELEQKNIRSETVAKTKNESSSTQANNLSSSSSSETNSCSIDKVDKKFSKFSIQSGSSSSTSINKESNSSNDLNNSNFKEIEKFIENKSEKNKLLLSRKQQRSNQELVLLTQKIKAFRAQFKHNDGATNSGLVISPTLYSSRGRDMSVKLIITSPMAATPLNFTCNVSTTIEHLISHAVCSMFDNLKEEDSMDNYMLKVTGKDEYFNSNLCLADYALVSHCLKFDLDVPLTLISSESAKRTFARTSKDDFRCKSLLCPDDLLSRTAILKYSHLNFESLNIIIDTFEREAERLYSDVSSKATTLQTQSLLQTTKAICTQMLNCETRQLTESKENVEQLCIYYKNESDRLQEEDRYKMIEVIQHAIKGLLLNMHRLLSLTSSNLPVDYEVMDLSNPVKLKKSFVDTPINLLKDRVTVRIQLIAQLKPQWITKFHEFYAKVNLKHGEVFLCPAACTSTIRIGTMFSTRLPFDEELILELPYSSLPREARLVITLIGKELPPAITNSNQLGESKQMRRSISSSSISSTAPMYTSSPRSSQLNLNSSISGEPIQSALAISVSYIFDHELKLHQGDRLLNMHPLTEDQIIEDIYIETVADRDNPILILEFKSFPPEKKIYFPQIDLEESDGAKEKGKKLNFDDLDSGTKHVLNGIITERHTHEKLMDDERALLWVNRLYLVDKPAALPKVLLSAPNWSVANLKHIYQLLNNWASPEPIDALELLLPYFPDGNVRAKAVSWISKQHDDELCDYLPQLLQAFNYEKILDCSLFWLLLDRSLRNVRIANLLYWQLKLNASSGFLQERSDTMINCLLWTCGSAFWKAIDKQNELLAKLTTISNEVKKVSDGQRMTVLRRKLEMVQDYLIESKPTMPWAPSLEICDLELKSCSYFPSNTLPLKLAFRSCEQSCNRSIKFYTYDTIFKTGDDLRQDMLAIQMIRIMEKLWLKEGLDLRMVTFDCLATDERQGMLEMVQNAETLRKIQQNISPLTGAFNQKAIDNYIRKWNTSELEYKTALDKFLHSCAGYSVATYILGICDRHNDNIMITNSGHLFHIDFGKFLGDAQMMGSIKRDRTPFVLTADMAYVINGGDRPSKKFQTFIELCTVGFNIIRRHRHLFLNLFSLMSSARINGLNSDSVKYINKMLMPNLTEPEAMSKFTRLIDECLNSRSAQVNFFIHNLAQLRFSNDNSKQSILSFVPKTFTIQTDGKIESLDIVHLYKKYEPEKQYYYVVQVKRFGQPDISNITRTFQEFSELQMKLNCLYPSNIFHDINKSNSFLMDLIGRNNTREIAERRLIELRSFLKKLLSVPPEIAECNLIYTFFHPILRDQTAGSLDNSHQEESSSTFGSQEYSEAQRNSLYLGSNGQVKLSLSYKNSSLMIMIMHAKNLVCLEGSLAPNCYAKTYLIPDPLKQTKRKTRIIRQSCHPTFMELITYNIPLETLKRLTLQVSIWHSEIVQYKAFMGAALIKLDELDLSKEITSWYPLKNF